MRIVIIELRAEVSGEIVGGRAQWVNASILYNISGVSALTSIAMPVSPPIAWMLLYRPYLEASLSPLPVFQTRLQDAREQG